MLLQLQLRKVLTLCFSSHKHTHGHTDIQIHMNTIYIYIEMATLWNGEKVAQIVRCFNFFAFLSPSLWPSSLLVSSSLFFIILCLYVCCLFLFCLLFFIRFSLLPSSSFSALIVCVSSAVAISVAALSARDSIDADAS